MQKDNIDMLIIAGSGKCSRPHTLVDYQTKSRACLERLREIHPIFHRLSVLGKRDFLPIPEDLNGFEDIIAGAALRDKDDIKRCQNLGPDGRPGPDTLYNTGFHVKYFSYVNDAAHSHLSLKKGGIELSLDGCSLPPTNSRSFGLFLPTDGYGDLHEPVMVRRVLATAMDNWGLQVVGVTPSKFSRTVQEEGDVQGNGWMTYYPIPDLGECLPRDIQWEPFLDGVLVVSTPHPPELDNPDDVAAVRRVRDALHVLGLVQSFVPVTGWPPDEEEWRYEEVITGAPHGRKYRVHCVDFDGYDAERHVLLYTKLFRHLERHPKEWGFRGNDKDVLNEARRQVHVAQITGGGRIEWHIGLKEPAEAARELIAEYTDITEDQLKIFYTPLELALKAYKEEHR